MTVSKWQIDANATKQPREGWVEVNQTNFLKNHAPVGSLIVLKHWL
jgi:hypothetical protein